MEPLSITAIVLGVLAVEHAPAVVATIQGWL